MKFPRTFAALAVLLIPMVSRPVSAQNPQLPPPGQAAQALQQAVQQNPGLIDVIRQRLQGSGLTPEQIRARLAASGYPPDLLDAYLGPAQGSQSAPVLGNDQVAAIEALGLGSVTLPSQSMSVDTGMIKGGGEDAAALASGNYVFGVDVFRRSTTQFLPTLAGPVPPDYRLGPGDHLVLILTGDVESAQAIEVTREGFVVIPQVGQIFVANLTLDQVRDVLYTRLHGVYSGITRGVSATTHFGISVANVRVNQVYVIGEVTQPGAYQISALGTVLTALYAAGGITDRANLRQIEVRRQDQPAATVDLYDYLLRGDKRRDVRLETGDVVFVPLHGTRAQITGAVRRPAIYELKERETLVDLMHAAGGFGPNAALQRLSIYRILPASKRGPGPLPRAVLDVPLPIAAADTAASERLFSGVLVSPIVLEDGDSVAVDSLAPLAGTLFVGISGAVNKPGRYPWRDGMTLRDLVLLARGPNVGAYLQEAEIARMPADRTAGQLAQTIRVPMDSTYLFERDSSGRYFGPAGLTFAASGAPEQLLQPYDNVLILRQPDFQLQRTAYVGGEVRFAGAYTLTSKDEKLADLMDRAGGLTQHAYPEGIRFYRVGSGVGRINIDLPRALKERTSASNIVLEPGDSIEIPPYQPSVKVSGAVNSPGSVLWEKGRDLEFYLGAAGGFSPKADKRWVSVRYANGQVQTRHKLLFFTVDPEPGPGSEVMIPTKEGPGTNWAVIASALTGVLSATVAILVLLKQL